MCVSTHWLATGTARRCSSGVGTLSTPRWRQASCSRRRAAPERARRRPGGHRCPRRWPGSRVLGGQGPAPAGGDRSSTSPGEGLRAGARTPARWPPRALLRSRAGCGCWRSTGPGELMDVLSYAIHYAEARARRRPRSCARFATMADLFNAALADARRACWLPAGAPPEPGERITNPAYARTLRRLLEHASRPGHGPSGADPGRTACLAGRVRRASHRRVRAQATPTGTPTGTAPRGRHHGG